MLCFRYSIGVKIWSNHASKQEWERVKIVFAHIRDFDQRDFNKMAIRPKFYRQLLDKVHVTETTQPICYNYCSQA